MAEHETEPLTVAMDRIEESILPELAAMVRALLAAEDDGARRAGVAARASDARAIGARLDELLRRFERGRNAA